VCLRTPLEGELRESFSKESGRRTECIRVRTRYRDATPCAEEDDDDEEAADDA
jgi:hypothetical protein